MSRASDRANNKSDLQLFLEEILRQIQQDDSDYSDDSSNDNSDDDADKDKKNNPLFTLKQIQTDLQKKIIFAKDGDIIASLPLFLQVFAKLNLPTTTGLLASIIKRNNNLANELYSVLSNTNIFCLIDIDTTPESFERIIELFLVAKSSAKQDDKKRDFLFVTTNDQSCFDNIVIEIDDPEITKKFFLFLKNVFLDIEPRDLEGLKRILTPDQSSVIDLVEGSQSIGYYVGFLKEVFLSSEEERKENIEWITNLFSQISIATILSIENTEAILDVINFFKEIYGAEFINKDSLLEEQYKIELFNSFNSRNFKKTAIIFNLYSEFYKEEAFGLMKGFIEKILRNPKEYEECDVVSFVNSLSKLNLTKEGKTSLLSGISKQIFIEAIEKKDRNMMSNLISFIEENLKTDPEAFASFFEEVKKIDNQIKDAVGKKCNIIQQNPILLQINTTPKSSTQEQAMEFLNQTLRVLLPKTRVVSFRNGATTKKTVIELFYTLWTHFQIKKCKIITETTLR